MLSFVGQYEYFERACTIIYQRDFSHKEPNCRGRVSRPAVTDRTFEVCGRGNPAPTNLSAFHIQQERKYILCEDFKDEG